MNKKFYPFWAVFTDYDGSKRAWINSKEKLLEVYPELENVTNN